ncbi:hypothetical protein SGRA_0218 [Saprospira grandis str. Lewin]|uniref:Uncharacterized protein n=1 Tax=Saprospira grandis (strain Lewin) TaxID=984262 RepID=H6L658_SAPGL|nr:hypothetical protein SGRA_0218 [Saprospira grandis str. Lewin]
MAVGFNLQLWPKAKRLRDRKQWPQARPSFFERSEKKRRAEQSCELRHSPTQAKRRGSPKKNRKK